jgi:hypothetical protein
MFSLGGCNEAVALSQACFVHLSDFCQGCYCCGFVSARAREEPMFYGTNKRVVTAWQPELQQA